MFVLLWCWGMISSEDVTGLSVCIPGFLGGVSPVRILEIWIFLSARLWCQGVQQPLWDVETDSRDKWGRMTRALRCICSQLGVCSFSQCETKSPCDPINIPSVWPKLCSHHKLVHKQMTPCCGHMMSNWNANNVYGWEAYIFLSKPGWPEYSVPQIKMEHRSVEYFILLCYFSAVLQMLTPPQNIWPNSAQKDWN